MTQDIRSLVYQSLWSNLPEVIEETFNLGTRARNTFNADLYDNQFDIIDDVYSLSVNNLAIVECRGAGKTYGVCVGINLMCLDIPEFQVGVFGPKLEQAQKLLHECKKILNRGNAKDKVDWKSTNVSKIVFKNGSVIQAMSGAETAFTEGGHFHVVVMDESQHISDTSVSECITPMLGSFKVAKMIKLGVSLYKNHFYRSFNSANYKKLLVDWLHAPILFNPGSVMIDGVEYPKYALDRMPLSLKVKMFPNRPDLHTDGEMSEIDFRTQYMCEWKDDIGLELSETDQKALIGTHVPIARGDGGHTYYAGLDIAGGALVSGIDPDWTALSIWRQSLSGIKEKVYCWTAQGNLVDQMQEIVSIIHPDKGLFPCKKMGVDYGGVGAMMADTFMKEGLPVTGIKFGERESVTGKNMKNAMFNYFKLELQQGKVKYPSLASLDTDRIMRKGFNEWCSLERRKGHGVNDSIQAGGQGNHDDIPCSDVLALWVADKISTISIPGYSSALMTMPLTGVRSTFSNGSNGHKKSPW